MKNREYGESFPLKHFAVYGITLQQEANDNQW